jgi:hypothetical protein
MKNHKIEDIVLASKENDGLSAEPKPIAAGRNLDDLSIASDILC